MDILVPQFWTSRRRRGSHVTIFEGRGRIVDAHGQTIWQESAWCPNALADEGEQNILNTWLLEQAALGKYLALLTAAPSETTTMSTMTELFTPGSNGYARQQISAGEWSTPALDAGDYQTTAAEKTFGPANTSAWTNFTHIAMASAVNGTVGKFLLYVALSGPTSLSLGQSFKYTLRIKGQ